MPAGRPRKNPHPSGKGNRVDDQGEASTSATSAAVEHPSATTNTASSSAAFPVPPQPPSPHPDDMSIDMDQSSSTPSGRRSSRRSARKVVNYRTQFDLDLSDEDDGPDTSARDKRPAHRSRRAASDQDSEDEFKPNGDVDGDADAQDSPDELEDDDDDNDDEPPSDDDDDDDEDDVGTSRSRRSGAKSSSKPTPRGATKKTLSSASKKPSRVASSKSSFPAHERRPALLPGSAIDGGFTTIDDIVSLSKLGKDRSSVRSLQSTEDQYQAVEEVRITWSTHNHYMQHEIRNKSDRYPKLTVLDTAWYPGKRTSLATEKKMRAKVDQYWKSNGADRSSLIDDIQVVGGVFLLTSTASDFNLVKGKDKLRYTPSQSAAQPTYANPEQQKEVQTFIEQDPIPRSQDGDFDVAMGVKNAEGDQATVHVEKGKGRSLRDCYTAPGTNGFVASCGSFISSVDWAPTSVHAPAQPEYLAVGIQVTSPTGTVPRTVLGARNKAKAPGVVQLWSLGGTAAQKTEFKLQYSLGIPLGEVTQVKWCPVGFDLREGTDSEHGSSPSRIGILACALTCGKVALYAMPRPEHVHSRSSQDDLTIELMPILSLPVYAAEPTCLDWAGGERLLVGTTAGSLLVWHTGHLLRSLAGGTLDLSVAPPPSHSSHIHETALTAASWLHLPPRSTSISDAPVGTDGYDYYSGLPHFVLTAGLDGSTRIIDIDALDVSFESQKQREPLYATSFLSFLGTWISDRGDNAVRIINTRPAFLGRTHLIGSHQGRCTALDSSAFHPLLASGTADGTLTVLPTLKNVMRFEDRINWPVYRLELNRGNGQLRYVDNYTTATYSHTAAASKGKGKNAAPTGEQGTGTLGSFHPAIRITDVSWCKNLAANPFLLASGSACGLLRVDLIASDVGGDEGDADVDMNL